LSEDRDFGEFFRDATGHAPYPYQVKLGTEAEWPTFLDVPTGLGKTAVILAWLWRRRYAAGEVRRLRATQNHQHLHQDPRRGGDQ